MVIECQVIARRSRDYVTSRGKAVKEDMLVLFESGTDCPLTHTVDWQIPELQRGQEFKIGSRVRLAVTEVTTSEFGRRILFRGSITK